MKKHVTRILAFSLICAVIVPVSALARPQTRRGHHRPSRRSPRPTITYRHASRSHSGWSHAGSLMAGVVIGSVMQSAWAAPPRRSIVRTRTVYVTPPVQEVHYLPQTTTTVTVPSPTEKVWVMNSNGSMIPVELRRAGGGNYIGPRGEYYSGLPTNEQLRKLYGF